MRKLPSRLRAIAELIPQGSRVCDVGTDHGLLPVWLVINGISETAVAADISEKCLARAEETARANGVFDKITFICSDGLNEINNNFWDVLVIAGMGGETVIDILKPFLNQTNTELTKTFILQPNTKQLELSLFLRSNGFTIIRELMVRDNKRNYLIQMAVNN